MPDGAAVAGLSVTAPRGFVASGTAAGLKSGGALDLALVATDDARPVPAAGVFTSNRATAAPVIVTRAHLEATGGRAAAVVLNSGNANAATGRQGRADAETTAAAVAVALATESRQVLVCSTGLIGIPLDVAAVVAAVPALVGARSADGADDAARAILTTDTLAKQVAVDGGGFTVGGMAKGAAMLAPRLATMLAVLTTDAEADPAILRRALGAAVDRSFNSLSVDGCTSTNDTVLVLASGRAGAARPQALEAALTAACTDLAAQMAGDAEGVTKVASVTVSGAASTEDARRAARQVAESQLVKCSWYGGDPYWGRIVSELGAAGVGFDPELVSVAYGGVTVCRWGIAAEHDADAVRQHMAGRHVEVTADLGIGAGQATVLATDLTHAYVDENMGTS